MSAPRRPGRPCRPRTRLRAPEHRLSRLRALEHRLARLRALEHRLARLRALGLGLALLAAGASVAAVTGAAPAPGRGAAAEADSLLTLARRASAADRHDDAIAAYERAERLVPDREAEIAAEAAYQYAWAGRLGRAERAFDRALAARPDDYDLRLGRLLVVNWMGDHLEAARGYRALAVERPGRPAPRVGLASALRWQGRADRARRAVDRALDLDPEDRDARALRADLDRARRPVAGVFYDGSEDSDHYRLNGAWVEAAFHPHLQWELAPFVNPLFIRRPDAPDIDETWAGATVAAQPADRWAFRARGAALLDRPAGATYLPLTGSATLTAILTDRLRAGVSAERFAVVSYRTWPEKIPGHAAGAFLEGRPDWRSRVRVSADRAAYRPVAGYPRNRRWNLAAAGSREVWSPARVRLGASLRWIDFERDLDNGTWTPRRFRAAAATAEWDWGTRGRWSVNGGLELGPAREAEGRTTVFAAWRVGLFRALGPVLIDATVGHSEGNVETGTGYDRSYAHLGLRRRL